MHMVRLRALLGIVVALVCSGPGTRLCAGGSGLSTVVVINQSSTNSIELANYFCWRRQVPAENVLRIHWSGGAMTWTSVQFQNTLLQPLLEMLAERQLTNQIDRVVLSMDIPYAIAYSNSVDSTTAALFYGLKDDGADAQRLTNSYAGSERAFADAKPSVAGAYSFLACMLTADSLAQAKALVDQGVASDGTFPRQPVVLAKSSDAVRNLRYRSYDNAIFNARLGTSATLARTNSDSPLGQSNLLGYETGLACFSISPNTFAPGAMADSLTSYGGVLFGNTGQTTLLAFIEAGASGSYGTVTEPTANPLKFPDPQVYFYQARGFSLLECYYQSLGDPHQGLIVAEPLAAPFAQTGRGAWVGISSNSVLSGVPALTLDFSAADANHPLQQVDLFIDGKFSFTLTNVLPGAGNGLSLNLNGYSLSYQVPANATLAAVASDLAAHLNAPAVTNASRAFACAHGDRIELHSLTNARLAAPRNFQISAGIAPTAQVRSKALVSSYAGTAGSVSTYLVAGHDGFLNSQAFGYKTCLAAGTAQPGSWFEAFITKTNGAKLAFAVTNASASTDPFPLLSQLLSLINSSPDLQGADGVVAEDLTISGGGLIWFNLRARSPGPDAAGLLAHMTGSSGLVIAPGAESRLTDNLSDLQPRNNLYVTAGAARLTPAFALDTTQLAEGYHELTAVAYEGSSVRTQTRASMPVVVRNTTLEAALTFLDLPDSPSAQGLYHVQVDVNAGDVTTISLFTTGGLLQSAANQSSAVFTVDASQLGPGVHPFYAVVQTAGGLQYRTRPQWVTLH